MSLDDLSTDIDDRYGDIGSELSVSLDTETRTELALLTTVLGTDEGELVRRAVHQFFQGTVDTGRLDVHLRRNYDLTYDEYLAGMTYGEMAGEPAPPENDDRRYQF